MLLIDLYELCDFATVSPLEEIAAQPVFFTYSVSRFPPTAFPSSENAMGEMARAATVSHSTGVRADTLNSAASGGTVMTVSWSAAHRAAQTVSFRFEKMPMLKTERRERILNE